MGTYDDFLIMVNDYKTKKYINKQTTTNLNPDFST